MTKKIPLNIVMTYPVHWGKYQILRDFIQNFYDSVRYQNWKNQFQHSFRNGKIKMWVDNISFNYEWLLHIGASTKTLNSDKYAGYFGEGFKIAALCAYRDMGWKIEMMSGNWHLKVISLKHVIDTTQVDMLTYEISATSESKMSCLELDNVTWQDYKIFLTALNSFYYPENDIMGAEVWSSNECAVYLRSSKEIDPTLPFTSDYGRKGAVFCGYQMMGTNPFGLVVCLHYYKKEDRERRALYTFEVIEVFEHVCYYIDAKTAMVMLEKMRKYWNSYPHKHIDIHSWSGVIDSLIYKISRSQEINCIFRKKHDNLLCLNPIHTVGEKNKRWQARAWLSQQETKYLLVKGTFLKLGYPTLEEECEKHDGFVLDEDVDDFQKQAFQVLEKTCDRIFGDFFVVEKLPEPKIITNPKAAYHGMAVIHRKKDPIFNNKGIRVRYDIGRIYLKKEIFRQDGFFDALSTYVHELCHMFGSDASGSFSLALTLAIEIIIKEHDKIKTGEQEWNHIFESMTWRNSK